MTRTNPLAAALIATLALAVAANALAGSPTIKPMTGSVGGEVMKATGQPIAGAKVVLFHDNGTVMARTITDALGRFSFPKVKPDKYLILAKYGLSEAATSVVVTDDTKIFVKIVLED